MIYRAVLSKMDALYQDPIQYYLDVQDGRVLINDLLDQQIQLSFLGEQCLYCGKKKKIFRQGACYDCFYKSPQMGEWIIRPELSKAHLGIEDRDLEYETKVQIQPHVVYLALSSNVKVGVTRKTQVPTRWIDQGANEAIQLLEVPNRYLAGVAEVALKEHLDDKTNWRKMLTNDVPHVDLLEVKSSIKQYLPDEVLPYYLEDEKEIVINYPVEEYPIKVNSLNLKKTPLYTGKLIGIKGQYLIFDDCTVFNIRSNEGTVVSIEM